MLCEEHRDFCDVLLAPSRKALPVATMLVKKPKTSVGEVEEKLVTDGHDVHTVCSCLSVLVVLTSVLRLIAASQDTEAPLGVVPRCAAQPRCWTRSPDRRQLRVCTHSFSKQSKHCLFHWFSCCSSSTHRAAMLLTARRPSQFDVRLFVPKMHPCSELMFGCCSPLHEVTSLDPACMAWTDESSLRCRKDDSSENSRVWIGAAFPKSGCSPCLRYKPTPARTVKTHRFPVIHPCMLQLC